MPIVATPSGPVLSSLPAPDGTSWQQSLRNAIRDPVKLASFLQLPEDWVRRTFAKIPEFPLFVTREFAGRIRPGDTNDPLLRQIVPIRAEQIHSAEASQDPVGDAQAQRAAGLLQKYQSRVLMIVSGACAIHCRYCFRRHFPYSEQPSSLAQWEPALDAINQDTSLREVILSGGDPLMVVDGQLAQLVERLAAIVHLKRLRLHTRLPIIIPSRVTDAMLAWLTSSRLTPIVVVHINHAAEIDESTAAALRAMKQAGVTLLNQAVLLRGVNDSLASQLALCEELVDLGVLPYYLHQLDRVDGAMHFEVPISEGLTIIEQLRAQLPGYAVPRYVQEVAGQPHKTILS